MSAIRSQAFLDAGEGGKSDPKFRKKSGSSRHNTASAVLRSVGDVLDAVAMRDSGAPFVQPKLGAPATIACPCCNQPVAVPTLELAVDRYQIPPLEARVLDAVWRGRGMPVMPERIFDVMYADDPNGGPSDRRMYAAFKTALCHLRARLKGSGIWIENVGYRRGYRLVMGEGK